MNYLALMGWSMPDEREIFSYQEMVEAFTWTRFSTGGPVFDVAKLEWLNNKYIQNLSDEELLTRMRRFLPDPGQEDALMVLAPYLKERLHRLCEVTEQVEFLYTGEIDLERETLDKQGSTATPALEALRAAETLLRATEPFDIERVEQALLSSADQRGWKRGPALMPIRYAISGKLKTPPLAPMVVALGRERTLQRLEDALDLLAS
jgi:glutamyl-tRNA synthetase